MTDSMRAPGGPVLVVAALALLASAPTGLAAQSLLSGYAFGTPLESVDGRSAALGGIGMGLTGVELAPHDPAAAVDLLIPAIFFTSQTSWNEVTEGGETSDFTSTRFPAVGIMYPVSRVGTVSLSFTGVLDQNWSVSQEQLLTLEGSGAQARVTDSFNSSGGVSALRIGLARRLSPALSLGVTAGTYLGNVTRRFSRSFDSLEVETDVPDFVIGGAWDYSGFIATAGASVDVGQIARISASYSLGGDLKASPTDATDGAALTMSLPGEYRVGGTALLSERLMISVGALYGDWASAAEPLADVEGSQVLRLGGGVEWSGARLLGKTSSLRLGYRRGELPFRRAGDPEVTESAITGGLGMNLLESEDVLLARADFAVERGTRDAGSFAEDFWRLTVTMRVSGF